MPSDDYYDLGSFHRPVSAKTTQAQTWFNRGLIWSYAFNHEEAIACFERVLAEDPDCLLAYFGLAYCLGPNYNKPWELFAEDELAANLKRAHHTVVLAGEKAASGRHPRVERALIRAIQLRYPEEDPNGNRAWWNAAYAQEMEGVYREYPLDLDVAALYADSLMNLTPWSLWDLRAGKPREGTRTVEAKDVLDKALALEGGMRHPGLLHLYIHLMEMSPYPERALNVADHLRNLVPDAGHLNHMPSHLDILCGEYRAAIVANSDAIRADEKWLARAGALNFYSLYRAHNYHFRIYAALFAGEFKTAMETVHQLEASLPESLLRKETPPMADWLEGFLSMRMHVLIRFGRWTDILTTLHLPRDQDLYCVTTAMTHYAKGIAHAVLGNLPEAEAARTALHAAAERIPASRTLFNNTCTDILAAGMTMLDGELEYRKGNIATAFETLRWSIELSDSLPYDEPWGWMQPPRHAYGALLLEQDRVQEAADVYAADLGVSNVLPRALQHPNNIWALHGYHECLVRLGREVEARFVKKTLDLAVAGADMEIESSCFCRRTGRKKGVRAKMA